MKPPVFKNKHPTASKSDPSRPNVRSATIRKNAKDGGFTPTELARKSRLMGQFKKRNKGFAVSISQEFREGYEKIDWSKG